MKSGGNYVSDVSAFMEVPGGVCEPCRIFMMDIVLVTQPLVYIVVSALHKAKLSAHRGDPEGPACMCVKEERGRDVLHRGVFMKRRCPG